MAGATGSWWLAWGPIDQVSGDPVWRDGQVALFGAPAFEPRISASGQFVVLGDCAHQAHLTHSGAEAERPRARPKDALAEVADLWQREGPEGLRRLRGGFGLVVVDRWRQRLWLVRDAVGIQTLYVNRAGSVRWIAPRLRLLAPHRTNALDLVALRDYLCCAFVPGARTLWADILELRPGQVHALPEERSETFFQPREGIVAADQPLAWHGERLRQGLLEVVADHLPEGEPIGVYLSGGLDSSCVTAIASQLHNQPVHTFSLHFGRDHPNELAFAELVANHCRTRHHVLEMSFHDLWNGLPATMAELDDPIGDPLTVPNLLIGRLAKRFVKVVFNGEGGDPCFGGPKNQPMLIHRLYGPLTGPDPVQAYLNSFQKCANDLPRLMKPEVWRSVRDQPSLFAEDLASPTSYLNRLLAINIKYKGADHILTKVNNLTQAVGLRACSPLFDRRIVELSMRIPPEHKVSGVEEKAVLKAAVASLLPDAILKRPKSGMMVPVQRGFRESWNRQARQLLLNRQAAIADYFERGLINDWLAYRGDLWNRYGIKLWLLSSLEFWLQANRR